MMKWICSCIIFLSLLFSFPSCKKASIGGESSDTTVVVPPAPPFDINSINDTYADLAPFANYLKWGPYNVHDPSIIRSGDYFYCYSTDAGFGIDVRAGLQIRKSKDLVQWQFVSWVFPSLPAKGSQYITTSGGMPFNSLWAPYVLKVGSEYRLYYSLSCAKPRLSVIGLATSSSPEGPWTERGLVVTSKDDASIQTNAIDPTVIVTTTGEHYFYYGSAWDGIYMLKLDPATGLALNNGDKGKRIANRGFTGGKYNGNIEAPEIIYNATLKKYFLFISYDWLETKYNVRVGRSDKPDGPFLDFNGLDINTNQDHPPLILGPYKFEGHGGWQGVAHCSVFEDNGQFYMAHQGRPGVNKYFMDLHVRKVFWTQDGWPVVSPERYAWEDNAPVAKADIIGDWDEIILAYTVTPGYGTEQTSPDFQVSNKLIISADGTVNLNPVNKWTYNAPWLEIDWGGFSKDKLFVQKGRDWENKKSTIVFSGMNEFGSGKWGKKR